jgi:hypothetical protein
LGARPRLPHHSNLARADRRPDLQEPAIRLVLRPKFDFSGRVTVYPAGDSELRQFVEVIPQDLDRAS